MLEGNTGGNTHCPSILRPSHGHSKDRPSQLARRHPDGRPHPFQLNDLRRYGPQDDANVEPSVHVVSFVTVEAQILLHTTNKSIAVVGLVEVFDEIGENYICANSTLVLPGSDDARKPTKGRSPVSAHIFALSRPHPILCLQVWQVALVMVMLVGLQHRLQQQQ